MGVSGQGLLPSGAWVIKSTQAWSNWYSRDSSEVNRVFLSSGILYTLIPPNGNRIYHNPFIPLCFWTTSGSTNSMQPQDIIIQFITAKTHNTASAIKPAL